MAIEFRCPNGHRLSCPDDRAGRPGKCPKCGSPFRVPALDRAAALPESAAAQVAEASGIASASSVGEIRSEATGGEITAVKESPSGTGAAHAKEESIVFLCPNGHKLNCPISMQGRPGKCPHCGAKFLIPQYDDDHEEGEEFLEILGEHEPGAEAEAADGQQKPSDREPPAGQSPEAQEQPFDLEDDSEDEEDESTNGFSQHAMAQLFIRLWQRRGPNGSVDLYFKGGEVLTPHWFSPGLSREHIGTFAVQDTDGSFTMMVVQWDTIERIALRGLESLPKGAFD